ncbi:hypothetical protein Gasu2_53820 [Galdieria sulphuraria]|nr:hypothetical protein Gasu2_53820 [Galdieria sulphuraria]
MKDKLSAHPVEKYWKERKQKEKNKVKSNIQKQSKRPSVSIESLEEEIASLIQKKNEGILLNAERERLRYLVQRHDNILEKQSKNLRNVKEPSQDPLDPGYGEDNRNETRKKLLGVQAFQRILKSKVNETSCHHNTLEQPVMEEQSIPNDVSFQSTVNNKTTQLIPLQVYQPTSRIIHHNVQNKIVTTTKTKPNVEQELNSFYAELQDIIDTQDKTN